MCFLISIVNFVRLREKDKGQSYALSLSYHNVTKHYKIDKRKTANGEVYAIEEGPTFENLMDVSNNTRHIMLHFIIIIMFYYAIMAARTIQLNTDINTHNCTY